MSTESSESPRQYNAVESRRFLAMINPAVQQKLFEDPTEDANAVETVVETYRTTPPENEKYADVKADAALDMLSNRLLMSDRKRLQIVRGHAHRLIQEQLRREGVQNPDMSSEDIQVKITELTLSLGPHLLLGQIARHYSRVQEVTSPNIEKKEYPPITLEVAGNDLNNTVVNLVTKDQITKPIAIGLLLMFGLREFSKDSKTKMHQKLEVVASKQHLADMLTSKLDPAYSGLIKISKSDAYHDKSVAEMLNIVYTDYMYQEKMDINEARRRFLIDSQRALTELFSTTE